MSLSKDQKRELGRLSDYFKKIEKLAAEQHIDLDVFMTEYRSDGFDFYTTEKIDLSESAAQRRNILEGRTEQKKSRTNGR